MLGKIGGKCWAASCNNPATHVLTTKILADEYLEEVENKVAYCLNDAVYFAGWLPYCYPGEYEVVSINPPASGLFS